MPIRPVRTIAADDVVARPDIQPRARIRQSTPALPPAVTQLASPAPASQAPRPEPDKVGYCNPPKATQFKPGQSGNPKGRPKGARGLNTIVIEKMTEKLPVRTARGKRKMAKVEVMVQQSIDAGLGGNERERSKMLERYRAAVPDEPILLPAGVLPGEKDGAPPPEEFALDLAMVTHLHAVLIAQAGGEA